MGRFTRSFSFRLAVLCSMGTLGKYFSYRYQHSGYHVRVPQPSPSQSIPSEEGEGTRVVKAKEIRERRLRRLSNGYQEDSNGSCTPPPPSSSSSSRATAGSDDHDDNDSGGVWDVVVVGGGAIGLYVGLDAASRGLSVAVLEAADFGSSNSGQCPSLLSASVLSAVQAGLRQREAQELWTAFQRLTEVKSWAQLAPHLVRFDVNMFIPFIHVFERTEGIVSNVLLNTLRYLVGGDVRRGYGCSFVSMKESNELLRTEDGEGLLRGGMLLRESRIKNPQEALLSLARTAEAYGACVVNYCVVSSLSPPQKATLEGRKKNVGERGDGSDEGYWSVTCHNCEEDKTTTRTPGQAATPPIHLKARRVVNAAGPWLDAVRHFDPSTIYGDKEEEGREVMRKEEELNESTIHRLVMPKEAVVDPRAAHKGLQKKKEEREAGVEVAPVNEGMTLLMGKDVDNSMNLERRNRMKSTPGALQNIYAGFEEVVWAVVPTASVSIFNTRQQQHHNKQINAGKEEASRNKCTSSSSSSSSSLLNAFVVPSTIRTISSTAVLPFTDDGFSLIGVGRVHQFGGGEEEGGGGVLTGPTTHGNRSHPKRRGTERERNEAEQVEARLKTEQVDRFVEKLGAVGVQLLVEEDGDDNLSKGGRGMDESSSKEEAGAAATTASSGKMNERRNVDVRSIVKVPLAILEPPIPNFPQVQRVARNGYLVEESPNGLLSIVGGDWLMARKAAMDTVDIICEDELLLLGSSDKVESQRRKKRKWAGAQSQTSHIGLLPPAAAHTHTPHDVGVADESTKKKKTSTMAFEDRIRFLAREEYATKLADVLARRTRALYLCNDEYHLHHQQQQRQQQRDDPHHRHHRDEDIAENGTTPPVVLPDATQTIAEVLTDEYGWSKERFESEMETVHTLARAVQC